jgi:hypothetical protein
MTKLSKKEIKEGLKMKRFLGLDIGSTTVKAVLIDDKHNHLIQPIYLRSLGRPLEAFKHAIQNVRRTFDGEVMVGITGSGREIVKDALDLPEDALLTEIYAHSYGAWHLFPGDAYHSVGNIRLTLFIRSKEFQILLDEVPAGYLFLACSFITTADASGVSHLAIERVPFLDPAKIGTSLTVEFRNRKIHGRGDSASKPALLNAPCRD